MQELAQEEKNKERLKEFYGKKLGEKFLEHIDQGEFKEILEYRKNYITKFLARNPSQILDFTASLLLRAGNKFKIWSSLRVLNPFNRAPLVSFMGIDKSGKSTLSEFTTGEIERWNYDAEKVSGSVFQHYPPMSWLNKLRKRGSKDEKEDEEASSYNEKVKTENSKTSHLEAAFRLSNAAITCLKISLKRQRGLWIVTDRYIWDLAFFTAAPQPWEKLMKLFFPNPSLPFHVKVTDETLEERNCELNENSRKKIRERFEKRKDEYNLVEIENEDLEKAKERIREEILPLIHGNDLKY